MMKPRRRGCTHGYTLIEFLIVLGIVAFLAAIILPVFTSGHENARRASCQSNLKQIGLAFTQYTQDYDDKIVPIAIESAQFYGWADALQPYWYQTPQLLQCPSEPTMGSSPTQRGYSDYWMNAALSRVVRWKISEPALTILSGDGNDGSDATNARYSLRALPQKWLKEESSPAQRHLSVMNILFDDGHVKALKANRLVAGERREYKNVPSFRWRP